MNTQRKFAAPLMVVLGLSLVNGFAKDIKLLNVSGDGGREFFQEYNTAFAADWKARTGETLIINQSHGSASKQSRAVLDGLEADIVTLNQALDIDKLSERARLIPSDWAARLPNKSVPYISTILFVVRKGNPKNIKNWDDLVRPGVSVVIPNPKMSGNGSYSYLAAWGYALKKSGGDEAKAREFVAKLFGSVPLLDAGGHGATTTFAQRGIGDALLTFESEAALILKQSGGDKFEVVVPSASIRADHPVVWVDRVVSKHGTENVARAYLEYLYSNPGQELAAKHNLRPQSPAILAKYTDRFKPIELFSVDEIAGGWRKAQKVHFADGGVFDQIHQTTK